MVTTATRPSQQSIWARRFGRISRSSRPTERARAALAFLDSAASSQKPEPVIDAARPLLPGDERQHPPRRLPALRAGDGAVRGGAAHGGRLHQRRIAARDHLRPQHDRGDQPRRPDLGPAQHQGRRSDRRHRRWSTTPTSCPGSFWPRRRVRASRPSASPTTASSISTICDELLAKEPKSGRVPARLEQPGHDQPGRRDHSPGARCRRRRRRRRGAERAAHAGRRAGARCRFPGLLRAQDAGADGVRRALRQARAARGDAAVHGRRRHDPQGVDRALDLGRRPGPVRGGNPGGRRRDRARRRGRVSAGDRDGRRARARAGADGERAGAAARGARSDASTVRTMPTTAAASSRSRSATSTRTTWRRSWTRRTSRCAPATTVASR